MLSKPTRRVDVVSIKKDLDNDIEALTKWLSENSLENVSKADADEAASERLSWHYGYLIALRDMREVLAAA
jgi:hypothetical protein